jgi:predicted enzyme related to lactoylglutathione lyase
MLGDSPFFANFSVDDVAKAKQFYETTLGIKVVEEYGGMTLYNTQDAAIFVYPKDDHEPAKFTVIHFPVKDVEQTVNDLKTKGVTFETYTDEPLKTDENNISRNMGMTMAWFKDPAGNMLGLMQQ